MQGKVANAAKPFLLQSKEVQKSELPALAVPVFQVVLYLKANAIKRCKLWFLNKSAVRAACA